MNYRPPEKILEKYANVLINFALNRGRGVKKKEVVFLNVPECAKPALIPLRRAVLKSGAYPIIHYLPDGVIREFFQLASEDQLKFFPAKYLKGQIDQTDHVVSIIADADKHELKGIDPKKIMTRNETFKPYKQWRDAKEAGGRLTWTVALYGTRAMAKEAGLTLKEYWEQIIKACYLDKDDPVEEWKKVDKEIEKIKTKLNNLRIEKLHIRSKEIDLMVGIGKNRRWMSGNGVNIPSFEIFTSPDYRVTEGQISFNQPLYRYGNLIRGIKLKFRKGRVVEAKARQGEKLLKEVIKVEGADRIGEVSLTDGRFSRIGKFMAEILYDENRGGRHGNMHLALGSAYKDTYPGNYAKVSKKQWDKMGYNDSVIHVDIVSTADRVVTAYLPVGRKVVIYKGGRFII